MGTLVGHVAPGFGFMLIGLWHLFNHIKLHAINPNNYTSPPWFPTSSSKYLELFLIMFGCTASISMELFIGPDRHQPFDPDGTIPSNHLHNFEHSSISMTFFVYAAFAIVLDKLNIQSQHSITQLIGAIAFGQQLLLFHLHSADHMGPEGQYHMLLQLLVLISLLSTLLGIGMQRNFLVSFVRSISIFFQGIWLMTMGFMLWTPGLIPKGCFMNLEEGHKVVRCRDDMSLYRANSLVTIQFSWFFIVVTVFAVSLYIVLVKFYKKIEYFPTMNEEEEEEEDESSQDLETPKKNIVGNLMRFIHVGKPYSSLDIER
ncbi:uncharacterized protein LOC130973325 [Arachis stenosperma]|uniref:uncharacterized protein LOC130973325 n=1 Tax=Arachis stenosperma TaxID=217475 RepID=UPI0025AD0053|nr:uncharacterized protein LOC130973325 [Arachis stenosperma]